MSGDWVFTWDAARAEGNQLLHGGDPHHVVTENYFVEAQGEQRYVAIGMSRGLALLVVVFVDRVAPDREIIHLISARKAERYEEKIYAAHFRNQNH